MTRRLRRGSRACSSMVFSPASVPEGFQRASGKPFGAPAGAYLLPRVGIDAPTTAREVGLPPDGFGAEGFQMASGKPFGAPAGAVLLPRVGLTRRLRRGSRACSPMGRSHFSFDGERKVCKRKPAARRLREKGFYCPFCRRGSLCRAQHDWPDFTSDLARSELAYFRRQNGRAFFPPLPIAALAPAVGVGHTQALRVGIFWRGLADSAGPQASGFWKERWPLARAARPSVERRPWGRKRRKREALRRAFPERHVIFTALRGSAAQSGPRGTAP